MEIGDTPANINDLTVGLRVEAETERDDDEVKGTITALGTVTISDSKGTPITLTVNASTSIERVHEPATIFNLQIGDPVVAEFKATTADARRGRGGRPNECKDNGTNVCVPGPHK